VEVLELLLLQENLDRDAQDEEGNTALHVAADNQQTLAVQTLLEAGCPPHTENKVKFHLTPPRCRLISNEKYQCKSLYLSRSAWAL
jgi:ankyrin repeat protein